MPGLENKGWRVQYKVGGVREKGSDGEDTWRRMAEDVGEYNTLILSSVCL